MTFNFNGYKEKITSDIQSGYWIFRGHSNVEWLLKSSFQRFIEANGLVFSLEFFFDILERFTRRVSNFWGIQGNMSLPQKIALAQHYGLPTPFLDWTESPYIACFFALYERRKNPSVKPFRIWALRVNEIPTWKEDELKINAQDTKFTLIRTQLPQSKRLERQLGLFTYHGFNSDLKEYINSHYNNQINLKNYDIEGERWLSIIEELRLMGISASSLFDNIDGISEDLMLKIMFELRNKSAIQGGCNEKFKRTNIGSY